MNIDFENGRKEPMPYQVPDDFFGQLEERVMTDILQEVKARSRHRNTIIGIVMAAAACLAILLVMQVTKPHSDASNIAYVEEAFSQLNAEDQAYILDTYQSDIFLNE